MKMESAKVMIDVDDYEISENDYKLFLDRYYRDDNGMLLEEERFHEDPRLDTEMMKGSKQRYETRRNGSDSVRK